MSGMFLSVWITLLSGLSAILARDLPLVGSCTFRDFNLKSRTCYSAFIHALQKNPTSKDCSSELEAQLVCTIKNVKACFKDLDEYSLRPLLKGLMTKEAMCDFAGVQAPAPLELNTSLPCNITIQQYTSKNNKCSERLITMWQKNKADPGLCGEYTSAKFCINQTIAKHCTESGWFQQLINLYLGSYNPFCASGSDTTPLPPSTKPTTRRGKTTSLRIHTTEPNAIFTRSGVDSTSSTLSMMPVNSTEEPTNGKCKGKDKARAQGTASVIGKSWWMLVTVLGFRVMFSW